MAGEWFRRTPARENIEANDREEAGQVRTEDESIEASRTEFCESDESLPLSESTSGLMRRYRIVTDLSNRLIEARPRVVFRAHYVVPGFENALPLLDSKAPDSNHVYGLIHFLKHGEPVWTSDGFEHEMSTVISAYYRCAKEGRSKGSWVMDYVRPLLDLAIDDLPLESWSVQAEPYVWGPIPELEGDATSRKCMLELVITLNRVMKYIRRDYAPLMFGRLNLNL
ncbi:similar to An01g12250 [Aspergillus luchuensis IFO 4308]|nr:similar to An01g12250 [Aspergillus luchuensis IFO 4308]